MLDAESPGEKPRPLQQHSRFAAALTALGQKPLLLDRSDLCKPQLLVLRRKISGALPLAMVSRMPVDDAASDLRTLAQTLGRSPVILSPDSPCPQFGQLGAVPLMTPATVAEIDLSAPQEARRASLHQKWRNRLKQAERSRLRIARQNMPTDPDHWLLQADKAQRRVRGYRTWPAALTLAFARANPGHAKLFTAFDNRDPVAAMLFLAHAPGATYHVGFSTDRGRRLSAHNLILWTAANWLADKGCTRLELGLLDTANAPGLARFKLGSGASSRRLGGTWLLWSPLGRVCAPLARLDQNRM